MDYKEKLEEAKRLYETANQDQRYVLESLFPELKESEDERIRKALIRFHKSSIDIDGIKGDDILAWLEKQGEQKPAWSEEDEEELDIAISTLKEAGQHDSAKWLKSLKDKVQPQPKQEWSEEDAFRASALTDVVKSGGSIRPELRNEFVDWLKSIKNRVIPQPKPAWSV